MFRKAMQIGDDVVFRFFELLSRRSNEDIAALKKEREAGRSPLEIKALFAREMVERFHGREAAERAASEYQRVYANDGPPEHIESAEVVITTPTAPLGVILARAGLAPTTSMANAVIQQGGVVLDGEVALEWRTPIAGGSEHVVRFGSKNRRWKRIRVQQKT
jgi:tyrosyl-tRNA synthetase